MFSVRVTWVPVAMVLCVLGLWLKDKAPRYGG